MSVRSVIKVRVHPGSARTRVAAGEGFYEVWVREKAIEGRATQAAQKTLADFLGCPASALRLVRGAHSRYKWFELFEGKAA